LELAPVIRRAEKNVLDERAGNFNRHCCVTTGFTTPGPWHIDAGSARCARYRRLAAIGKPKVVVTTAIAREMVGFISAIARIAQPEII
jgi:hypothetical protein